MLQLGNLVLRRRGNRGIREVAAEIGISPATLSRVERGKLPDLVTFQKICIWLKEDPASILGVPELSPAREMSGFTADAAVHLRADATLSPTAASDLAALILAAQQEAAKDA